MWSKWPTPSARKVQKQVVAEPIWSMTLISFSASGNVKNAGDFEFRKL